MTRTRSEAIDDIIRAALVNSVMGHASVIVKSLETSGVELLGQIRDPVSGQLRQETFDDLRQELLAKVERFAALLLELLD